MSRSSRLLWCGIGGAISFIAVLLVNDVIKPAYDPVRDFVSEAAIGRGGWVQTANFLTAGTLLALSSPALSRVVSRWTGRLVGIVGAGLVGAGVFETDPVPHDTTTWHGAAHNIVSVVVFACLSLACFTAARWRPAPLWRLHCLATGTVLPVLFVTAAAVTGTSGLWQRASIIVGWSWLAALGLRAVRAVPADSRVAAR
jgi:hypothetical membrane protein